MSASSVAVTVETRNYQITLNREKSLINGGNPVVAFSIANLEGIGFNGWQKPRIMALYPARWIFVRTSHNVSSRQVRQDCNERCERMYVTKTGTWNNIVKIIVSVLIDRETSINSYIYWYFHDILSLLYNI